jgi:hypothetical protein
MTSELLSKPRSDFKTPKCAIDRFVLYHLNLITAGDLTGSSHTFSDRRPLLAPSRRGSFSRLRRREEPSSSSSPICLDPSPSFPLSLLPYRSLLTSCTIWCVQGSLHVILKGSEKPIDDTELRRVFSQAGEIKLIKPQQENAE